MKMLLDTNVLVSSILSSNAPRRLLDGARRGEFELVSSETLLREPQKTRTPPASP